MTAADDRRRAAAHVFVGAEELTADGTIALPADIEHHIARVLRLRDGSPISVSDGRGSWRMATVIVAGREIRVDPRSSVAFEPAADVPLVLATAIPKGDRLDWLVQKATELGVDRLQLLETERSVVRWKSADVDKKMARLHRIVESAAQQSRRTWLPEVLAPVPAAAQLPDAVVAEPGGRPIAGGDRRVAIGPEGGWSDGELEHAGERVTLGPNVLRTETAGIAAITLCVAVGHADVQSRPT